MKSEMVQADSEASHSGLRSPDEGSKFTPGPWKMQRAKEPDNVGGFDCAIYAGASDNAIIVAEAYEVVDYGIRTNVLANARLISAAPDMYDALQAFLETYVALVNSGDAGFWNPEKDEFVIRARAALAKADGTLTAPNEAKSGDSA